MDLINTVIFGCHIKLSIERVPDWSNTKQVNTFPSVPDDSNDEITNEHIKDCLILLVKAESASAVISAIRKDCCLNECYSHDLYVNTMKMWIGTTKEFESSTLAKEFGRKASLDSFVKEYDYYAMRFLLKENYKGGMQTDESYEKSLFFQHICEAHSPLITISERLSFDTTIKNEAYAID